MSLYGYELVHTRKLVARSNSTARTTLRRTLETERGKKRRGQRNILHDIHDDACCSALLFTSRPGESASAAADLDCFVASSPIPPGRCCVAQLLFNRDKSHRRKADNSRHRKRENFHWSGTFWCDHLDELNSISNFSWLYLKPGRIGGGTRLVQCYVKKVSGPPR